MERRFSKEIIARDIKRFLLREGLIHRKYKVVIPKESYERKTTNGGAILRGRFEILSNNDIKGYGGFEAFVPKPYNGSYKLYLTSLTLEIL